VPIVIFSPLQLALGTVNFHRLVPCRPMLRLAAASLLQTRQLLTITRTTALVLAPMRSPQDECPTFPSYLTVEGLCAFMTTDALVLISSSWRKNNSPVQLIGMGTNGHARRKPHALILRWGTTKKFGQAPDAGNLHWHFFSSFPFCSHTPAYFRKHRTGTALMCPTGANNLMFSASATPL